MINDILDFLYRGKWIFFCCLKVLCEIVEYIFDIFSNLSLRYWLEGGSFFGVVRLGDIILWDISVDIGIYMEDILKC